MTSNATSKTSFLLVRFRYGAGPTDVDYTNDSIANGSYAALPSMLVEGLENSGDMNEKPITVEVPKGIAFFDALVDGRAHAPVYLYIDEVLTALGPSGAGTETLKHAIGDYRLQRAYRSPDRNYGFVKLEFSSHKTRAKIPLGIVAMPTCAWTLGDKSCQVAQGPGFEQGATISAIVGKKISLTNPADAAVVTGNPVGTTPYWHRGTMTIDGLSIGIRRWVDGSYDFDMIRQPPVAWLGATVTLRAGCAKTVADCTSKFANVEHFGGLGIAIPSYEPDRELS